MRAWHPPRLLGGGPDVTTSVGESNEKLAEKKRKIKKEVYGVQGPETGDLLPRVHDCARSTEQGVQGHWSNR